MPREGHPYRFFDDRGELLGLWGDYLSTLSGHPVEQVLGVWDARAERWHPDAPAVVRFAVGDLSAQFRAGRCLSLGVGDFEVDEPPAQDGGALCWRPHPGLEALAGDAVASVELSGGERAVTGIVFRMASGAALAVENAGGVAAVTLYTK